MSEAAASGCDQHAARLTGTEDSARYLHHPPGGRRHRSLGKDRTSAGRWPQHEHGGSIHGTASSKSMSTNTRLAEPPPCGTKGFFLQCARREESADSVGGLATRVRCVDEEDTGLAWEVLLNEEFRVIDVHAQSRRVLAQVRAWCTSGACRAILRDTGCDRRRCSSQVSSLRLCCGSDAIRTATCCLSWFFDKRAGTRSRVPQP